MPLHPPFPADPPPPRHGWVPQLHDHLTHSAWLHPDKVALVCGDRRVTYRTLDEQANALAHHLTRHGVQRGDRVMVYADNAVETVVAFWAALKANAVVCIANPLTRQDKLQHLLGDCTPAALVADLGLQSQWVPALAASASLRTVVTTGNALQRPPTHPADPRVIAWDTALGGQPTGHAPPRHNIDQDLAAIIYTSGSTGQPKGVMLTHRNMLTACESITSLLGLRAEDVVLSVLPLAFNYGLYQMIMSVRVGGRLVLEKSFAFPAHTLKRMAEERVTGFPGVPTMFALFAQMKGLQPADYDSLRFVTNTAANLPHKHIEMLHGLFRHADIYSMYGLTECKRCSYLPPRDLARKPDSVGIAIPNTELWLVDEQGRRLPPGSTGELVIRGGTVMKGYWNKPEETARRLKPGPLPGEWVLHTGDQCRMDEEGYLYFISRMDDIIKSRGEKVAPKEVENALQNITGVRESAVIGVPDEVLGQAIKAFVVLDEGAELTEKQLQLACQRTLESFMVPKHIVLVPALPRTETGKIKKQGLESL